MLFRYELDKRQYHLDLSIMKNIFQSQARRLHRMQLSIRTGQFRDAEIFQVYRKRFGSAHVLIETRLGIK